MTPQHKIYPTLRWFICLFVSLALLFAAMNYQRNTLHWLAYTCWALLFTGTIYSWLAIRKWKWQWTLPEYVFANMEFDIKTPTKYTQGFFGPGDLHATHNTLKTDKVGQLNLKVSTWSTYYPLGFFNVKYTLPPVPPIWIYPEPVNHHSGMDNTATQDELTALRAYQPGDKRKHILKKTQSLPMEQWQVKSNESNLHNAESKATTLDWSSLPEQWTTQQKLEQLSYDVAACSEQTQFNLVLPHYVIESGAGSTHKHKAWQTLAMEWDT